MLASRTPWRGDEDLVKKIKTQGKVNREGYVNVAAELGLSGVRGKVFIFIIEKTNAIDIVSCIRLLDISSAVGSTKVSRGVVRLLRRWMSIIGGCGCSWLRGSESLLYADIRTTM